MSTYGPEERTIYRPRRRRPRRRWPQILAVVLGLGIFALLGSGAWLARGDDEHLPPGIEIAGVAVGGMTVEEAERALEARGTELAAQTITLVYEDGTVETTGAEMGAEPQTDEAIEEAQGSRGSISRLKARLGFTEPIVLRLRFEFDESQFAKVARRVNKQVRVVMQPAGVELQAGAVVVVPSQEGRKLAREELAGALEYLPSTAEIPVAAVPPSIGDAAAEETAAEAQALIVSRPIVAHKKATLELEPALLRKAVVFEPDEEQGTIGLALDPEVLEDPITEAFERYEREPVDATFRVDGDKAFVVKGKDGLAVSVEKTTERVLAAGGGKVKAAFAKAKPELTTQEAKRMKIRAVVSEFTTPYSCCQSRVLNIQRAAQILDGTIIPVGGTFSLNEELGPRTAERGFAMAPQIGPGNELVDVVGGGVSQVATTFYNAAFFAGLELIQSTPHSFYISRYPMGREATVSWGGPELIFRNDWKAAILVKVYAADTSITVRFYSAKLGRRVETVTGEPYDHTSAEVIRRSNPELAPGTSVTTQSGGVSGFSVDYTRKVFRHGKLIKDEKYHVVYQPEDTIIEVGPKVKTGTGKSGGSAEAGSSGGGSGSGGGGAGSGGGGGGSGGGSETPPDSGGGEAPPAEPPPPPE